MWKFQSGNSAFCHFEHSHKSIPVFAHFSFLDKTPPSFSNLSLRETPTSIEFFFGGTFVRNAIQHIQCVSSNLRCKHVPIDALKELIASNNLTRWLQRSLHRQKVVLPRLGSIQRGLQCCSGEERKRERYREVANACREAEKRRQGGRNDHHLLLVFLISDLKHQRRPCISMIQLQTSGWNVIERKAYGVILS